MYPFGFVITRHVTSEKTNAYWIECIQCIQKHYGPFVTIAIVDDNSNKEFVSIDHLSKPDQYALMNRCFVVNSDKDSLCGRGEILGYYYLLQYRWFKQAVVIHDSVFLQSRIICDAEELKTTQVKFIWHFDNHIWDNIYGELETVNVLNHASELTDFYHHKEKWHGCFGVMSVIDLEFLEKIWEKYSMEKWLSFVTTREKRMCVERIFAMICQKEIPELYSDCSFYGVIHSFIRWEYSYEDYQRERDLGLYKIVKVWTGR